MFWILILIRVIEMWISVLSPYMCFCFWVLFLIIFNQHSQLKATWWIKSSQTIVISGLNFVLFSQTFRFFCSSNFAAYISFVFSLCLSLFSVFRTLALPIHWIYTDLLIHCFKFQIWTPKYKSNGLYTAYVCVLLLKWHSDNFSRILQMWEYGRDFWRQLFAMTSITGVFLVQYKWINLHFYQHTSHAFCVHANLLGLKLFYCSFDWVQP